MEAGAMRPTVLLTDDDEAITNQLAPLLERSGFAVRVAHDGGTALDAVEHGGVDLIVLDVLMPGMDGRAVLRALRGSGCWTPVVLLTCVGESVERTMALEEGADDYLNKPFDPYELVARLRAVQRRAGPGTRRLASAQVLRAGALRLDRTSRRVWLGDRELVLTPRASVLLEYLMTHPDQLVSRERLLESLWGYDFPTGTRAVDNRIAELRKALGDDSSRPAWIQTVSGLGYRFIAEVEGAS